MRKLFARLAKIIYKQKYSSLQDVLLFEYNKIENSQELSTNILSKILISGEDHRFRYHFGFDVYAIVRATKNRLILNKIEGASTIEQQIVRVLTNDYRRSIKRKIQEIFLSTTLSYIVPRNHLPAVYLSIAYYGTNLHGLKSILQKLKIQNTEAITVDVAAEIVSRIKYPESINRSINRQMQIEKRKQHLIYLYEKHQKRKLIKIYE